MVKARLKEFKGEKDIGANIQGDVNMGSNARMRRGEEEEECDGTCSVF